MRPYWNRPHPRSDRRQDGVIVIIVVVVIIIVVVVVVDDAERTSAHVCLGCT
jgi:t-SNARE complex subunit (syntaxin)